MVGAVTGLGLDLPSRCDVSRWVSSGEAWWNAQVAAVAQLMPGTQDQTDDADSVDSAEPEAVADVPMPDGVDAFTAAPISPAPEVVVAEIAIDQEFAAVVDAMVESFTPAEAAPVVQVARLEVGDDLYPGVAFALNRDAEGLPSQDNATEGLEVASGEPSIRDAPEATRANRLETAVKLTGKAFEAWVALLQAPAVLSTEH
jgi:hypothetical protein